MKKLSKGFTLIELMIVVAIIGIMAAITVPAYKNYTGIQACIQKGGTEAFCRAKVTGKQQKQGDMETEPTPAPVQQPAQQPSAPLTQCIAGYTFVDGKQVINATGGGVVCQ